MTYRQHFFCAALAAVSLRELRSLSRGNAKLHFLCTAHVNCLPKKPR